MNSTIQSKKIFLHNFKKDNLEFSLPRKNSSESAKNAKKENQSPEHNFLEKTTKSSNYYISPNSEMRKNALVVNDLSTTIFTNTKFTNNNTMKYNSDDSIHENDFDDCRNNLSENDDVDEFSKKSSFQNDFYTNSIGEATQSFMDKGKKLINNIPQPFVKQFDRNKDYSSYQTNSLTSNHIQQLLKQNRESNCRKLLILAQKGDKENFLEALEIVLKIDPSDINFADEAGWTALHHAVNEGNLKIVNILIKSNANVNSFTFDKKTPLHIASTHGYFDISKLLVENGAMIGLSDNEKNNPLHITAQIGHMELLKFLLDRYPQADSKNIYGKTPIEIASSAKIKILLQEYLTNNSNKYHKVTIHKTNNKSANNLILNFKSNNRCESYIPGNTENVQRANHVKYQSDYILNTCLDSNSTNKINKSNNFNNKINVNINIKDNIIIDSEKTGERIHNIINQVNSNIKAKDALKIISVSEKLFKNEVSSEDQSEHESKSPLTNSLDTGEKISPNSFLCHALIGKGSFGEVYLVEKKNTKSLYAMKVLNKDKIMAQNLVRYAITERNVLSVTNHPFIVKLSFAFQTYDKLFLILDYCPGGDLAEHLAKEKRFTEERAKIYLCEIILALEDLHKRDIIFRDLKPDNVVLDRNGHALLTDFGLSKEGVLDNKAAKSFCGSIAYLAPEMLKRTGHGKSVDWYLLGVLFYEMLVGIPPYFTNNKEQIFKNIEKGDLQIPKYISPEASCLLRALLNKDPHLRLGAGKLDAVEVKSHPYFKDINWTNVLEKKLIPPIPPLKTLNMENFKPKIFDEGKNIGKYEYRMEHFDGWSFVNNEENK